MTSPPVSATAALLLAAAQHTPVYVCGASPTAHLDPRCPWASEALTHPAPHRGFGTPWDLCSGLCGQHPMSLALAQGLRCAHLHAMLNSYLTRPTRGRARILMEHDPSTFTDLVKTTADHPDPHDLGLDALAQATATLVEQYWPAREHDSPRTHLVIVHSASAALAELTLAQDAPLARNTRVGHGLHRGALYATTAATAARAANLHPTLSRTTVELDAPLTSEQLAVLASAWELGADLRDVIAAVRTATH